MEISNRFALFASPSVYETSEEHVVDIRNSSNKNIQQVHHKPQKLQNEQQEQQPKSQWDIPEYVEKPIPCAPMVTESVQVRTFVPRKKKTLSKKAIQREEEGDQTTDEVPMKDEPIQWTYHPPQPHKFKQTPSKHSNQTAPKFPRKTNDPPKQTPSREPKCVFDMIITKTVFYEVIVFIQNLMNKTVNFRAEKSERGQIDCLLMNDHLNTSN
ncbi:unnamed protein product [Adineta ricciae]|uniref:Uncharacterized protein n=1 Tax=Adineta ricciae TaxID=249248 RepID=A0A813Q6V4_ADIRI|nr:unnamed protein product [Adineta ricciae]